jgi:predicted DNA-binding protein YlxM (UPF0122 family)
MRGKKVEMALLLDYYGGLLTPKQHEYFDLYYNDDLTLSEIGENVGITAPGVHDIITRAGTKMRLTEEKTGFIRRANSARAAVAQAIALAETLRERLPETPELDAMLAILNEVSNGL